MSFDIIKLVTDGEKAMETSTKVSAAHCFAATMQFTLGSMRARAMP
jgi:hypothetical protein